MRPNDPHRAVLSVLFSGALSSISAGCLAWRPAAALSRTAVWAPHGFEVMEDYRDKVDAVTQLALLSAET